MINKPNYYLAFCAVWYFLIGIVLLVIELITRKVTGFPVSIQMLLSFIVSIPSVLIFNKSNKK